MNNNYVYRHGAVLLLEEDETRETLSGACNQMRKLGLNTAVIWPPCFYKNGKRDWSVQHLVLDCAAEAGLKVVIELTGQVSNLEYLPDAEWKVEYAVTNFDNTPSLMQNGLGELNYNHPEVKTALKRFFLEAVDEFKSHPALLAWDVWNESHFKSYDPWTIGCFRKWLEKKYSVISKLNTLWKKSYCDFNEIRLDPVTWASITPDTDWEEFRTDNLAAIAKEWTAIVRNADPMHPVFADNVMSNTVWSEFDRGSDDWKLAREVDTLGVSFYPKTGGRLLKVNEPWLRTLTFAGAASAGNGSFMVAEMQSHCYSEIFICERVAPEELLDWNLEALFQGAQGCIYWKWSPFKAGFQLGGRGLVLADGSFSKRAAAVKKFSEFLDKYPDVNTLHPVKKAALLYDRASNFTVKAINNRIRGIIGDDQCARARFGVAMSAFKRNVPLSVVTTEQLDDEHLNDIQLLFLPWQLVMDDFLAEKLSAFVKEGGTLVASFPFGDVSPEGRLFADVPGGPLNRTFFGARQTDNLPSSFGGVPIEVQELELSGDTGVLLQSDDGLPLLLERPVGKGRFFYCTAPCWSDLFDHGGQSQLSDCIWEKILSMVKPFPTVATIPITCSAGNDYDYIFIENSESAPECLISTLRPAELIFGEGTLSRENGQLRIVSPRHTVLRLAKEN